MSLLFLLNPKQFVSISGSADASSSLYRKKKLPEIEQVQEIIESILPEKIEGSKVEKDPTINKEIQAKIGEYLVLSRQIEEAQKKEEIRLAELAALQKQLDELEVLYQEQERLRAIEEQARLEQMQKALAKRILEMQEEEEAVIMMLLN